MLEGIQVPTLLLDEAKCKRNILKIAQKAIDNQVVIRPHFKTHQSHQVGRWFREAGVNQITVSSFRMADYFAEDAWNDITVAFPANILEINRINTLARKIQLNLCIENLESLQFLEQHLQATVGLFLKINAGNNRSGLGLDRMPLIDQMMAKLQSSNRLDFKGFLGHAGQSYKARSDQEIIEAHQYSKDLMQQLKNRFQKSFPHLILSLGDTPTCSVAQDFTGIDEIRPGNFAYYDVTQAMIGSCTLDEVAVAMACPVVAKAPERNEVILYGGGVHFSKDRVDRPDGTIIFGLLADWTEKGWTPINESETYMRGLSQEHGVLKTTPERIARIKIGDLLPVLPVHSCMAADLMKSVRTLDGQTFGMLQFV